MGNAVVKIHSSIEVRSGASSPEGIVGVPPGKVEVLGARHSVAQLHR